jgi:WD40 repeat protein
VSVSPIPDIAQSEGSERFVRILCSRNVRFPCDRSLHLWRVSDGREVRTIVSYAQEGYLGISRSSQGWQKEIKLWRVSDGQPSTTLQMDESIESILFSPDGQLLLVLRNSSSQSASPDISLLRARITVTLLAQDAAGLHFRGRALSGRGALEAVDELCDG